MDSKEMQRLMNLSLDKKIELSQKTIHEAIDRFGSRNMVVTWTGGKDSTTMLWLYRAVCKQLSVQMPRVIFIDEGDSFDEIIDFVESFKLSWSIDVITVKNIDITEKTRRIGDEVKVETLNEMNKAEIAKLGYMEDTFFFDPESYIGNHLMKTVPLNTYLENNSIPALSTAIRWDEHNARVGEDYFSPRKEPDHVRVHPILHFKEKDIWDTIFTQEIPFCSLYCRGYRSLGTKSSTVKMSDIPAWEQDLENSTERAGRGQDKEKVMEQLRSLGYI